MSNIVESRQGALAPVMPESELIGVLRSSLYPGAKAESIKLVLGYCKAAGLDPMQKPVHIVPMKAKEGDKYVDRDVVMPGISLYRAQASRSGDHLGTSEPEFGPPCLLTFKKKVWDDNKPKWVDAQVSYPEWCRVTVKRRVGNTVAEFVAVEYWTENYATAGRDTDAPNAMWERRPRGQLAKCAESQALRRAFPEFAGAPTAEEMEGKELLEPPASPPAAPDFTVQAKKPAAEVVEVVEVTAAKPAAAPAPEPADPDPAPAAAAAAAPATAGDGERRYLLTKIAAMKVDPVWLLTEHEVSGVDPETLAGLTKEQFARLKAALLAAA
jgi:phage recombination protein Bet